MAVHDIDKFCNSNNIEYKIVGMTVSNRFAGKNIDRSEGFIFRGAMYRLLHDNEDHVKVVSFDSETQELGTLPKRSANDWEKWNIAFQDYLKTYSKETSREEFEFLNDYQSILLIKDENDLRLIKAHLAEVSKENEQSCYRTLLILLVIIFLLYFIAC